MDAETATPLEMVLEEMQTRAAQIRARIADMNMLIEQEQLEAKRLRMKSVEVNERVKRVQQMLGLGIVPASDFTAAYDDNLEIRTRLVKLQSHLDHIQTERQQDEAFGHMLEQWIATLQPPTDEV